MYDIVSEMYKNGIMYTFRIRMQATGDGWTMQKGIDVYHVCIHIQQYMTLLYIYFAKNVYIHISNI